MNVHRVNAAAGAIHASMQQGKSLPAALAYDLEAMGLLQSPETAAELAKLRARVADLESTRLKQARELVTAWARVAELEATLVDLTEPDVDGAGRTYESYQPPQDEYRYCGADLGRTEFPFTCNRRIAHKGTCGPDWDHPVEAPHEGPEHHTYRLGHDLPEVPRG